MTARELYEQLNQTAARVNGVSETIAQKPVLTLGMAVIAGYMLGRIIPKSRHNKKIRQLDLYE